MGKPADLDLLAWMEAALIHGVARLHHEVIVSGDPETRPENIAHIDEFQNFRINRVHICWKTF